MTEIKKELKYFNIGKSYGGNQRWMLDPSMHMGGCAALTTCDAFIQMARHKGRSDLYPYDASNVIKKEYKKFGRFMKLYLRPRETGIKDLDTYMDGVRQYLSDTEITDVALRGISGEEKLETAVFAIRSSIDKGIPVSYLMLKHQNKKFNFFEWHWFLVVGYEEKEGMFYIKVATYGKKHWLCLNELWDTGCEEKGGIVIFELN